MDNIHPPNFSVTLGEDYVSSHRRDGRPLHEVPDGRAYCPALQGFSSAALSRLSGLLCSGPHEARLTPSQNLLKIGQNELLCQNLTIMRVHMG